MKTLEDAKINDQYYALIKDKRTLIKEYVDRVGSLMNCSCVDNSALDECDRCLGRIADDLFYCYSNLYKNANNVLLKKLGI